MTKANIFIIKIILIASIFMNGFLAYKAYKTPDKHIYYVIIENALTAKMEKF